MTQTAEWQVGDIPASPEAPPDDAPAGAAPAAGAPAAATEPGEWTDEDVAKLLEILRGPYDKIAAVTTNDGYKLSELEELPLVGVITSWMPPSWVRAGQKGQLPMVVGIPLTLAVVVGISLPRLGLWNLTHPEARIEIPIPFTRLRIGGGHGAPSRPRAAAPAAGSSVGDELGDRGAGADDVSERAGTADVGGPVNTGDGGPPADTPDDIRRSYAS